MSFDNDIYKAVQDVGINVNKEELLKALRYDRNQYDKGYSDGYEDAINEFLKRLDELTIQYPYDPKRGIIPLISKDIIDYVAKEMKKGGEQSGNN